MNLLCPHCTRTVTVADSLAGQTTKCSYCGGPFTVPLPPSTSPASETPKTVPLQMPFSESPPEPSDSAPGQPSPSLAGDFRPRFTLTLHPEVVRWTVPACLFLLFVLLFFPWVTSPLPGKYAFSQTGLGAAFAMAEPNPEPRIGYAPWMILYFLVLLLGVLVSAGLLAARFVLPRLGVLLPPPALMVISHRTYILGGLALLTLVFLALQLVMGLPAEYKGFAAAAPEHFKDLPQEYEAIMGALLHRTVWVKMAFTINLIAVLAALADFWLERRVGRPWPKLVVEW
jgi:hypothetical protein